MSTLPGLRVGLGPFTCQSLAERGPEAGDLQRHLPDLAVAAESAGFDSFWLSEHHLAQDGYLSSAFPMLGALAAVTERLILGTKVILAPLYHPLRLAEDAAQVANLSGGRLILGMGIGYREAEYDAFGVPLSRRGKSLDEVIALCRKAWTGGSFSHESPGSQIDQGFCRPRPRSPVPIWLGGRAPAALRRAAEVADGFIPGSGDSPDIQQVVRALDSYRQERKRGLLPLGTGLMVGGVGPVPKERLVTGVRSALSTYAGWMERSSRRHQPETARMAAGRGQELPPTVVIGDAATIANRMIELAGHFPGREQHLILRVDFPGMSARDVLEHIRWLAAEVLPAVRSGS